jgi:hypothetical protein
LLSFLRFSRFCHSELTRKHDSRTVRFAKKILCRPTEAGVWTLMCGDNVGAESHGQYVLDCKITPTVGLCMGEAGAKL